MADKSEAHHGKELRRTAEAKQRASEEAGLPVPRETLWALFDYLDESLADGCDHSLRLREQFLDSRSLQPQLVVPWESTAASATARYCSTSRSGGKSNDRVAAQQRMQAEPASRIGSVHVLDDEVGMIVKASLAFLAALVLASCHAPSANPEPERRTVQSQDATHQNEALVRRYYQLFNAHRWEDMAALYAPTAQFKDPSLGPGVVPQTREQIAKKYADLAGMFPDIKDTVVATYPSGSRHIVVEFVSSGTAPDGSKFELPIATIFTVENGLITHDFTYYDNFGEG